MSKKLRVALVSAFPPGRQSLSEYGWHFANALANRDDVGQVIVIADKAMSLSYDDSNLSPKIIVVRTWEFNSVFTLLAILSAIRRMAPDCVIFNIQVASFGDREVPAAIGLFAPFFSRAIGIPSGVIMHNLISGMDLEGTKLRGKRFRKVFVQLGAHFVTAAICRASYVTVTLHTYLEYLKRTFPRANVTLVPHGTFDLGDYQWLDFRTRPKRIVTLGKFGTYKKLDTLLQAFDLLRADKDFEGYELMIGGMDHPAAPGYLKKIMTSRRADHQVHFTGYLDESEVANFFRFSRLSVFDYESTTGSSGVLNQSASFGSVPVFPNIGDFVDVCAREGLRGYNYLPSDAVSLANAMKSALLEPEACNTLAFANRQAVRQVTISDVAGWHVTQMRSFL